jgi:hypothetical protein
MTTHARPPNPLDRANIFSLNDLQVTSVPVGCRNPYVRYATKAPLTLSINSAGAALGSFVSVVRFPTLGFRRLTAQFTVAQPPDQVTKQLQLQYYLTAFKDSAAGKPFTGGMISPPYDRAEEETEIDAKEIGLSCRIIGPGLGALVLLSFSVLVEP